MRTEIFKHKFNLIITYIKLILGENERINWYRYFLLKLYSNFYRLKNKPILRSVRRKAILRLSASLTN